MILITKLAVWLTQTVDERQDHESRGMTRTSGAVGRDHRGCAADGGGACAFHSSRQDDGS